MSTVMRPISLYVLTLLLLAGCEPEITEGRFGCDVDEDCPPGLVCRTNVSRCYLTPFDGGPRADAGPPRLDAGTDAGTSDAGSTDASTTDASTIDASTTDAGTTDAGATDASSPDAAASDGGSADASAADGSTPDGG